MSAVPHLHAWVIGEDMQGRVMLIVGGLLLIGIPFILKSDSAILRGMLIPLLVLIAMNVGYGGLLVARPLTSAKTEEAYRQNTSATLERELGKARKDETYYARARPTWALLTAVAVLLFFAFNSNYLRGLSLGLTAMFFGALLIDTFLHVRLLTYIDAMGKLHS